MAINRLYIGLVVVFAGLSLSYLMYGDEMFSFIHNQQDQKQDQKQDQTNITDEQILDELNADKTDPTSLNKMTCEEFELLRAQLNNQPIDTRPKKCGHKYICSCLDIPKQKEYDTVDSDYYGGAPINKIHHNMGCTADNKLYNRMKYMSLQPKLAANIRARFNKDSIKHFFEAELSANENQDWWDLENEWMDDMMT